MLISTPHFLFFFLCMQNNVDFAFSTFLFLHFCSSGTEQVLQTGTWCMFYWKYSVHVSLLTKEFWLDTFLYNNGIRNVLSKFKFAEIQSILLWITGAWSWFWNIFTAFCRHTSFWLSVWHHAVWILFVSLECLHMGVWRGLQLTRLNLNQFQAPVHWMRRCAFA